jgi:hypothetical protein
MKNARFYLFTAALTLLIWGCAGPKQVQGTYKVTGSAGVTANIIYAANGLGGNSTANNQVLPWQTTFSAYESEGNYQGTYVFLSAVNDAPSTSSTSITITILEDNAVYQSPNYTAGGGNPITLLGNF